jgi:hypothetical protein
MEALASSETRLVPPAASNMKSVQFLQSLNLPVGLTTIPPVPRAILPIVVTHFEPISERLSPKTTTVSILRTELGIDGSGLEAIGLLLHFLFAVATKMLSG